MRSAQGLRVNDQNRIGVGPPADNTGAADERVEAPVERSRQDASLSPTSKASGRSLAAENDQPVRQTPGIGQRLLRTTFRFGLAILIGVAGTLAWQSYGAQAQNMIRSLAPALDWLIPAATPKAANARSAELAEQLKPIALDLAVVRKAVEQLAANQEQLAAKDGEITQSLALLQASEKEIGDKISALPPPPKPARARPRRAAQHSPLPLIAQ